MAATNVGWKAPVLDLPAEVGHYQLDYPAYFGDQLALYPSNPITKEGVFLGRMLFYEKKLLGDVVEFTRFAYYLSNLRLRSQDGTVWQEPDSYHLLETAEDDPTAFTLALTDLPAGEYTEISFAVGLDSVVNHGPNRKGVLNPDFGMFWEWESDYVFLKCEGYFQKTAQDWGAFVYHVAGDQTYRAVRLKLAPRALTVAAGQPKTLGITADARQLFEGFPGAALTLQLTQPDPTTSIMAGGNATKLADNYARMFAVENIATY